MRIQAIGPRPCPPRVRAWASCRRLFRRSFAQVEAYAAAGSAPTRGAAADGPLWVVLGDSAAQGVGASAHDRGWVGARARARSARQWRLVNLSRSGARTREVVDVQWPRGARRCTPDLVTAVVGGNDALRTPLEQWLRDAGDLVRRAAARRGGRRPSPAASSSARPRGSTPRSASRRRRARAAGRRPVGAHRPAVPGPVRRRVPPQRRRLPRSGPTPVTEALGPQLAADARRAARGRGRRAARRRRGAARPGASPSSSAVDPVEHVRPRRACAGTAARSSAVRHLRRAALPQPGQPPRRSGRRRARSSVVLAGLPEARAPAPRASWLDSAASSVAAAQARSLAAASGRAARAASGVQPPGGGVVARQLGVDRRVVEPAERGERLDQRASAARCRRPGPAGTSPPSSQPPARRRARRRRRRRRRAPAPAAGRCRRRRRARRRARPPPAGRAAARRPRRRAWPRCAPARAASATTAGSLLAVDAGQHRVDEAARPGSSASRRASHSAAQHSARASGSGSRRRSRSTVASDRSSKRSLAKVRSPSLSSSRSGRSAGSSGRTACSRRSTTSSRSRSARSAPPVRVVQADADAVLAQDVGDSCDARARRSSTCTPQRADARGRSHASAQSPRSRPLARSSSASRSAKEVLPKACRSR